MSRGYNQRNCRAIRDFLPTMNCTQYNAYLLSRMYNLHFSGYINTVLFRNVQWEISIGNRFLMTFGIHTKFSKVCFHLIGMFTNWEQGTRRGLTNTARGTYTELHCPTHGSTQYFTVLHFVTINCTFFYCTKHIHGILHCVVKHFVTMHILLLYFLN